MHSRLLAFQPEIGAGGGPSTAPAPIMMVIDAERRLVHATPGGRALLAHGRVLHRSFDKVATTTQANARRLSTALADAASHGHAHMVFDGPDLRLDAEFVCLEPEDGRPPHIIVTIREIRDDSQEKLIAAQAGFGLTRTEVKLVAALFEGCSVPQAAGRLGVARSTARTHLQRVFDKTGVRRQADLMRIVATA